MFNKYFINDNTSAVTAARITAESNDRLGRKLEGISQAEIKSKDRVDISLEEYLEMRGKIAKLEGESRYLNRLVRNIGIPVEVIDSIMLDSINVTHCDHIHDFKRTYCIKFDVDASPDLMKWRYEY